jgi:IclR family acetate operon transcriptional repressor
MSISSAEKVLRILKTFSVKDHEVGNLELSEKLGFPRSTVNRLLHVLESSGFVRQNPETKKYMLGRSAADIGRAFSRSLSTQLVSIAYPHLDGLRDRIGETVGLEVISGNNTTLVYEAQGPSPVRVSFNVGDRLPFHVAAGAKAILAFSSPDVIESQLKEKLTRFTPNTITRRKILKSQLEEIRRQGVAFDHGELNSDVHAMGAPIFNHDNKPVAAIVIAAPAYRMQTHIESNGALLLKETAAKISAKLFYSEK